MNILLFNGGTSNKNTKNIVDKFKNLCEEKNHKVTLLDDYYMDCTNCQYCATKHQCCIKDKLSETLLEKFDCIVIGTPTYFFHMSAKAKAFLDRLYPIDKTNLIFSLLCVSGSEYEYSGIDLIIESLGRACDYCGSHLTSAFCKTTNDTLVDIDDEDINNMNTLIEEMEVIFNEIKENK